MTGPDALRRGFDNVLANWQLILIRVVETAVVIGCLLAAMLITVLPIFVAIGVTSIDDVHDPESIIAFFEGLIARWPLLGVAFVVLALVALLLFVLHVYVEAGVVRVYLDAESAAGPAPAPRERFAVFSGDRWLDGAKSGWKVVFWIYNIIWSIWGLIILIPLLFGGAALLYFLNAENTPMSFVSAGVTLLLLAVIGIPAAIVANAWTQKAIVVALQRGTAAREATRIASAELRGDFAAHAIIVAAVLLVSFVLSGAGNGMASMGRITGTGNLIVSLQVMISLLNAAVSAATAGWMVAAFAALPPKGK